MATGRTKTIILLIITLFFVTPVLASWSNQPNIINILKNGNQITGFFNKLNFIEGTNTTLSVQQNGTVANITITASGGSGGEGTPATTVTDETTYGLTKAAGTGTNYAREDHTHGSPPDVRYSTFRVNNVTITFDNNGGIEVGNDTLPSFGA